MFCNNNNSYKSLFISFVLYFLFNGTDANQHFFLKTRSTNDVLMDLPLGNTDLMRYLRALESVTKFARNNEEHLDFQYYFSLFLVNVQLRSISIPAAMRENPLNPVYNPKIWNIVVANDRLLRVFIKRIQERKQHGIWEGTPPNILFENAMVNFMVDSSKWVERIDDLNLDLLSRDNPSLHKDLLFEYPEWSDYIKAVSEFDEFSPSPLTSDQCLTSLDKGCKILANCQEMVISGNTFGYFLTHRFLYLLLAHLGKGCYIFSPARDRELRKMLCSIMYVEASYIASNEYKLGDLMVEQMSFCALDGHAQFLRRSWLDSILTFQTDKGCFYIDDGTVKDPNGVGLVYGCNLHTTALAASSLAAAVRYVLERTSEMNDTYTNVMIVK